MAASITNSCLLALLCHALLCLALPGLSLLSLLDADGNQTGRGGEKSNRIASEIG